MASRAIAADDHRVEAYIIRGQTYLGVASLTYSKKDERAELNMYAEKAIQDFSRALQLEPVSTWAYLGRGDALTWQKNIEEAMEDYERILQIDPLFDVARQRLITIYTDRGRTGGFTTVAARAQDSGEGAETRPGPQLGRLSKAGVSAPKPGLFGTRVTATRDPGPHHRAPG